MNQPCNLEEGLMLYEKWKAGGHSADTDGTDRLNAWMWEYVDDLFKLVEFMVESLKIDESNEQSATTANNQSPESPDTL